MCVCILYISTSMWMCSFTRTHSPSWRRPASPRPKLRAAQPIYLPAWVLQRSTSAGTELGGLRGRQNFLSIPPAMDAAAPRVLFFEHRPESPLRITGLGKIPHSPSFPAPGCSPSLPRPHKKIKREGENNPPRCRQQQLPSSKPRN